MAVHRMRTEHVRCPELAALSVYARCNLAEDGPLQHGEAWPDVPLVTLDGKPTTLGALAAPLTVVCSGSYT